MKNKFFTIILTTMLVTSIQVNANNVPNIELIEENNVQEKVLMDNTDKTILPNIYDQTNQPKMQYNKYYKKPVSKKNIAKKFLLAMIGVGISSILLFIFLTLLKNIKKGFSTNGNLPPINSSSPLSTPNTLEGAINIFLEKTDWNN